MAHEQVSAAFAVAERHRGFESLVRLANDPKFGSVARISGYLDSHGRDFAYPLYTFYLEEGQSISTRLSRARAGLTMRIPGKLRALLEPEEAHRDLLTAFLDSTENDRGSTCSSSHGCSLMCRITGLAWINDIAIDRFEHATEALTSEATREDSIAQKKVRQALALRAFSRIR